MNATTGELLNDRLLPARLTTLIGVPKSGKTNAALRSAISVAKGGGSVLYLSVGMERNFYRQIERALAGEALPDGIMHLSGGEGLLSEGWLRRQLETYSPALLVVDGCNLQLREQGGLLATLGAEFGCSVLLVATCRKARSEARQ